MLCQSDKEVTKAGQSSAYTLHDLATDRREPELRNPRQIYDPEDNFKQATKNPNYNNINHGVLSVPLQTLLEWNSHKFLFAFTAN
jgi:hypothetical protein